MPAPGKDTTKVSNLPASLYQDITLSSSANLGNLEEVLILVSANPQVKTGSGE